MEQTITKRIFGKTFFAALAFLAMNIGVLNAQTWNIGAPSGGANVTATLAGGTLTINGTGTMQDFTQATAPWYSVGSSITTLVIQSNVTNIGNYAFYYLQKIVGTVTIPSSVTKIGDYAFYGCNGITAVTIPSSVTSIGRYAFGFCAGLTSFSIPSSVTSIGDGAFVQCISLTAFNVDATNVYYSSVDGVLFNKNKTTLIQYPIKKTGTAYAIPSSVTSIGYVAFRGCQNLTSVTIPNSVASIGDNAFINCSGLTAITCLQPNPATITLGATVFYGVPTTICVLKVPTGSYSAYHTAPQWSDFTNIQETATGIENVYLQNLKIYPNPVKDELRIESGELIIEKVEICDLTGKTIYQFDNLKNKINVSALAQGIYIVKLKTDKGTVTEKFIKE